METFSSFIKKSGRAGQVISTVCGIYTSVRVSASAPPLPRPPDPPPPPPPPPGFFVFRLPRTHSNQLSTSNSVPGSSTTSGVTPPPVITPRFLAVALKHAIIQTTKCPHTRNKHRLFHCPPFRSFLPRHSPLRPRCFHPRISPAARRRSPADAFFLVLAPEGSRISTR